MGIEDGYVKRQKDAPAGGSRRNVQSRGKKPAEPYLEEEEFLDEDYDGGEYLDDDYIDDGFADGGLSEEGYLDEDYADDDFGEDLTGDGSAKKTRGAGREASGSAKPEDSASEKAAAKAKHAGGRAAKAEEEDLVEELDLFDDISLNDASIAEDLGMEDKIFGQAMAPKKTQAGGGRNGSGSGSGNNGAGSAGRGGRKTPRELNTAGSTVDQKRLKRDQEAKKKSRVKKIVTCVLVEILTLCLIFGYGFFLRTFRINEHPKVNKAAVENQNIDMETKKKMEGYWNFYVFGLDGRNGATARGNSDVIMIASVNMDTGAIKLVSVFRDTYLNISEKNQYNKINQAYAQGGPEQAIAALNKNLDLNITNYVTFNWEAVAHGINILGGIDDVDISKAELFYINAFITETVNATGIGSHQLKTTGPQHLDGIQAVSYARLRLMDNDFARTERQREVVEKAFAKAKQADFAVLNNILVDCFPMVAIDIPFSDLVRMAQSISKFYIADTAGFPWARGDANIPKKGACVIPTTLESNVKMLHEFLFGDEDYQPSNAVLNYSQKIKEDSNLYKEGKPIESVGTDNGVIQKPKTTAAEEDDEETEETTKKENDREDKEDYTVSTDEYGNIVYPTDEDGNTIFPTDENGDPVYPTDEDGNEIRDTRPAATRPTDLMEEPTEGDAGSEIVDDNGNVIGTSPYPDGSTRPTRPSQTVNPTGSAGPTTPVSTTEPAGPTGSVNPTNGTTGAVAPTEPTTAPRPTDVITDEPPQISPAPGGGTNNVSPTAPQPTAGNSGPGGSGGITADAPVANPGGEPVVGPGV